MSVHVRPATPADAAGCLAIYAPYVRDTAVSFETAVPDEAAMAGRIRDVLALRPWLVAEPGEGAPGTVAGYCYASAYRPRPAYQWSVEVTAYVSPAYQGRGVGGALYTALLDVLRRQGFVTAYAVITLPNAASIALHERHGFRPLTVFASVGYKLDRWHDVGWWRSALQPPPQPPTPPRPFAEVWAERAGAPAP